MAAVEAELTVTEIGVRGDGVADWEGDRVFVPGTVPGDRVRVRIHQPRKGILAGRVREVLTAGPGRAEPPCRHFGACGGCALQHLEENLYAGWKTALLESALVRAGLPADRIQPLRRSPPGARRRADFTLVRLRDRAVIGFNERNSNQVVDLAECPVMRPDIAALLGPLRDFAMDSFRPGDTVDVRVQATDSGLDLLLVTPARLGLAGREALAALAEAQDLARISRKHPKQAGAEPIVSRRPPRAVFGGVAVDLPAGAFLQATAEGEAALTGVVMEAAADARLVADLYCGVGTFALPLAAEGREVFATDVSREAAGALARAASASDLRLETEARNLERKPVPAEQLAGGDLVVFDPPRAGARAQAPEIAASAVPTVVAVSCNPASFARDAQVLVEGGYALEAVTPVDQFLWSPHLELAAVFRHGG